MVFAPLVVGALILLALIVAITMRPEVGVVVITFLTVVNGASVLSEFHGVPPPTEPLLAATLIGCVAQPSMGDRRSSATPWALTLFGVYGAVRLASWFWAVDPDRVLPNVVGYTKDIAAVALVIFVIRSPRQLRLVVWAIIAAGAFMAAVTVVKYGTGSFDADFGGFGQASVEQIVDGTDDWRIRGPFDDPNFFAQVLVMVLPFAVERALRDPNPILRPAAAATSVMLMAAVLFTFSRGGLLALGVLAVVAVKLGRPRWTTIGWFGLIMVVALPLSPAQFTDRVATVTELAPFVGSSDGLGDPSIRGRSSEVAAGWRMFAEHPVLGVGADNYPALYVDYAQDLQLDPRTRGATTAQPLRAGGVRDRSRGLAGVRSAHRGSSHCSTAPTGA